jgi:topoisomerase-4 subunit A
LRKLEEQAIRKEHADLSAEQAELKKLIKDENKTLDEGGRVWAAVAEQVKDTKQAFGQKTDLGRRRTELGDVPDEVVVPLEAVVEREPVTILCSAKGWVRSMKGHAEDVADAKHKEGDRHRFAMHAYTTDKLLLFATNGRFYTIAVDKLPGGRGYGEPVRLIVDLPNDQDIVELRVYRPGEKLVVASSDGRGFVVSADEVVAQTKNGKQVLNLGDGAEAAVCKPIAGDHLAVIGENRKMLVIPLTELPEMTRGRGTILQRYKDGGLKDVTTFDKDDGLSWTMAGGKTRTETDLRAYMGKRGAAGRLPPKGFPKSGKFE